jgi:hypothetical protein
MRRQLGVADGVAQVRLQGPAIVPGVGQGEAAGMPQHVRMGLEVQLGGLTSALHKPRKVDLMNKIRTVYKRPECASEALSSVDIP